MILAGLRGAAALSLVLLATAAAQQCSNYTMYTNDTGLVDSSTMLKAVAAATSADCCDTCTREPSCVAFTFVKAHTGHECRMTASPYFHGVHGVISGKNGRVPQPTPQPAPGPGPKPPKPQPAPKYPDYCKDKTCRNVLYFLR